VKYKIKLLHQEHLQNDYYVFDFEKPEGFQFEEGQYGTFEIVNKDINDKTFRVFSIASTAEESFIRIGTRIVDKPSVYKQELLKMHDGDELLMNAPMGKFTFEPDSKAVFIAGGIGITPIRSIILCDHYNNQKRKDLLIYSELDKCYPFMEELNKIANLEIKCASDIEPTQKLIVEAAIEYKNDAFYYISGSPGFVKGISASLNENGVNSDRIKFDVFAGYW